MLSTSVNFRTKCRKQVGTGMRNWRPGRKFQHVVTVSSAYGADGFLSLPGNVNRPFKLAQLAKTSMPRETSVAQQFAMR